MTVGSKRAGRTAEAVLLAALWVSPLQAGQARPEYDASIRSPFDKVVMEEGGRLAFKMQVLNRGRVRWEFRGKNPCFLSYHLLDSAGKTIRRDNFRFSFAAHVYPRQETEIAVVLKAPLEKGAYVLEFDVVREGVAWLKDYGSKTLLLPLTVNEKIWPGDEGRLTVEAGRSTRIESPVLEFRLLFKLIRLTLERNAVSFQGKTGKISAFSAGTGYPQIWLRDAATVIPASRYFFDEPYLRSWIVEHLANQKADGGLDDWIDARGASGKNTTETDQEASAVRAAARVSGLVGTSWLLEKTAGEAVISRLERALKCVITARMDKKTGLIKGAHTADWGDVDMSLPDERALDVGQETVWTIDIYDQAIFFRACRDLARMLEALGRKEDAAFWTQQAGRIRERTVASLWQDDKGFFRVHKHLKFLRHDFDEDAVFAMGGNAEAIISGLTDEAQARRIIEEALRRQKEYGLSTVSGSLLPPYPKGIFKYPMVDDPYEYQNGGQWDWFGGRLVAAMFEHGFARQAAEKLREIARKNIANGSFFEWDTPEGSGRGSDDFSGSAGALAQALMEGYFGIKVEAQTASLEPRLGEDEGKIRAFFPAAGRFVAYDYSFSKEKQAITLIYNGDWPGKASLRILSPFQAPEGGKEIRLRAELDGTAVPLRTIRVLDDEYLVLETDWSKHTLRISARG